MVSGSAPHPVILSIAKGHHRVDRSQEQQRNGERQVYEEPPMQEPMEPVLNPELAPFLADGLEIGERLVSRLRQKPARMVKERSPSQSIREAETAPGLIMEVGAHVPEVELLERLRSVDW